MYLNVFLSFIFEYIVLLVCNIFQFYNLAIIKCLYIVIFPILVFYLYNSAISLILYTFLTYIHHNIFILYIVLFFAISVFNFIYFFYLQKKTNVIAF